LPFLDGHHSREQIAEKLDVRSAPSITLTLALNRLEEEKGYLIEAAPELAHSGGGGLLE
jgi:ribosomal protein S12 methylthiotransferase accessory factor